MLYDFLFRHELVRQLLLKSMGKTNRERELVSWLIANFTFDNYEYAVFSPADIWIGFSRVLGYLEDTCLDIPSAAFFTAKFLARAIIDEVVPPSFVNSAIRLKMAGNLGVQTLNKVLFWIQANNDHVSCLSTKFETIWTGADPHSAMASECRKLTRDAVYAMFDESLTVASCAERLAERSLSPDLATVSVRKIIEAIVERVSHIIDLSCIY